MNERFLKAAINDLNIRAYPKRQVKATGSGKRQLSIKFNHCTVANISYDYNGPKVGI